MAPASTDTTATTSTRSQARTAKPKTDPKPKASAKPQANAADADAPAEETSAPKPPPQLQAGGGQADDLIVITTPTTDDEPTEEKPETIPVFSVDDVTYSMPAKPTAQQALLAIWNLRAHGDLIGGMETIANVCGEQALQALLTTPGVQDTHILRITNKIADTLFAPAREATKN